MDDKPLVSIWMVTYNHEKYIAQSIEAILTQETDFKYKLFIGDDKSIDRTAEICIDYQRKFPNKIEVFVNETNLGPNRNALKIYEACFNSGAKYIAMCEGDDYWADSQKLQKQVTALEEDPACAVVFHDAKIIDEEGTVIKASKLHEKFKRDLSKEDLMKGAFILTLSMCFRNCIPSFPKEFTQAPNGDTFLISLLGQHGHGKYMDDVNPAVYRKHGTSIWSSNSQLEKLQKTVTFRQLMKTYYSRLNLPAMAQHYGEAFDKSLFKYADLAKSEKNSMHQKKVKRILWQRLWEAWKRGKAKKVIKLLLS